MSSSKRRSFTLAILSLFFLCIKTVFNEETKIEDAKCKVWNSTEGLLTAKCVTDYDNNDPVVKVPNNLPPNLQVIDLRPEVPESANDGYKMSGVSLTSDMFEPYPQLKRILMANVIIITLSNEAPYLIPGIKEALLQMFVNLPMLEHLEMKNCFLDDQNVVNLPEQLKILDFGQNNYEHLNVERLKYLEELYAVNNKLIQIPKLAVPSSLKILNLNGNPLRYMNAENLAPLCQLWFLLLDFPPGSHYVSIDGYCDCVMLKKWANETELEGVQNVECFEPVRKRNCSEQILESARVIHKNCSARGPKPPQPTGTPIIPTKPTPPHLPKKNLTSSKFGVLPYFAIILDAVLSIPPLLHGSILIFLVLLLAVPLFLYAVNYFNLMEYLPTLRPTVPTVIKRKKKKRKKRKKTVRVT